MGVLQHQVLVCHFVKGGQSPLHGMCKIPGWHFVEDYRGFVQEAALRISTHGISIIKKASGFLKALALGVGEEQRFDDKIMLWHLIEEEELQVFQETAVDVAGEDCSEIVMNALTQIRSGQFTRLVKVIPMTTDFVESVSWFGDEELIAKVAGLLMDRTHLTWNLMSIVAVARGSSRIFQ
ncbi:hypothetical protein SELMODRAFT_408523 [Selaginella moellendorffii]|uniref:Uncharacterized protein n=1 Tax=Selaginella moellendorffii TaxID=88036 RepID=D8R8K5_SELML|nr:hypothetical protein SELMODRAFT_408523 [Selaginella moellendorffii]